jgi:mitogen-activated protein kinase kinase 1
VHACSSFGLALAGQQTFQYQGRGGSENSVSISQQGAQGFCLSQFRLGPELGRGEGGGVRVALHEPTAQLYALKEISIANVQQRHQLMKEVESHHGCGQMRDIVKLNDFFYDEGRVYLVLELMDWGSLQHLVEQQQQQQARMNELVLSIILRRISNALHFLHTQRNLIHRDLKPGNVVICQAGDVKLSDFGVSRVLEHGAKGQTFVGTVGYMSPERLQGCEYSQKADIWSLGIIAIECALGQHPFTRADGPPPPLFEIMQRVVVEDVPLPAQSGLSAACEDLIRKCLHKDENQRPSAEQLLQHPFLNLVPPDYECEVMREWLRSYQRLHVMDDAGHAWLADRSQHLASRPQVVEWIQQARAAGGV